MRGLLHFNKKYLHRYWMSLCCINVTLSLQKYYTAHNITHNIGYTVFYFLFKIKYKIVHDNF